MAAIVSIAKSKIEKAKLERICALYLRQLPRTSKVERVTVARRANPVRNWFVSEIEPALPLVNDLAARAALSELQNQFRLDD
ncbi:MAG TPA: hypothetical protein VJ750_11560 [Rhizomicrobium sp.]|nr:hypothetical protein [Rhizomicrobium sp.]